MTEAILVPEKTERIDLLDRQEFVEQLLIIVKALSDNRKNTCFAINGRWGSGKSFVLNMFEEQAQEIGREGQELPRYLIFRYNCWEYDYYDEPLVAIVASVLDQIDEKENLISNDNVKRFFAAIKEIGKGLAKKAIEIVDENTGINLETIADIALNGEEAAKTKVKEAHEYDQFFDFKKNLKKLKKEIASLAEDQTVLFIVDELDRCLPEYTIKVLERLHHLTDGIPNVQVILSTDMSQLEHVVKQIFGQQTVVKQYLEKFIDFELKLDVGTVKDHFDKRFHQYTKNFAITSPTTSAIDVEEFKSYILNGLDTRRRISVINRCQMLHNILQNDESILDSSYLCLEMLLVILNDCGLDLAQASTYFDISSLFSSNIIKKTGTISDGLLALSERFKINRSPGAGYKLFSQEYGSANIYSQCLLGKLLIAYRGLLGFEGDSWINASENLHPFVAYGKSFWELLQIVC